MLLFFGMYFVVAVVVAVGFHHTMWVTFRQAGRQAATERIGSLPNELVLVTCLGMDSKCFYNLLPVATPPAPLLHLLPYPTCQL